MLARLWWKEGRTLAPIAATLAVTALVLQLFLNAYGGDQVHNGLFIALGLGWAILYALVAATASFAGERETRMLGLLDALPVDRSMLWVGKATFALGSSIILAFALMMLGAAGSNPFVGSSLGQTVGITGEGLYFLLFEAVGWGLLWSSLCRTAIAAGIGAVVSLGVVASALPLNLPDHPWHAWALPLRVLMLLGAAGASWLVLTREARPRVASGPIRLRLRPRRESLPGLGTVEVGRSARSRRTILPTPAFYRLAWQTSREGLGTWLLCLGLGVATVVAYRFVRDDGTNLIVMLGILATVVLIQGVSAFGLENAAGTRSFLDHQAIPPGTAWAGKVVPWLGALAIFSAVVGSLVLLFEWWVGRWRPSALPPLSFLPEFLLYVVVIPACAVVDVFGVGLIAGMMFRRRVTATLLGLLALVVVALPQVVVLSQQLAPPWAALAGPAILLGASRAWAGDWLGDRGGLGRWARLAALVAAPSLLAALLYVAGRAYEVSDIGPRGFGPATTAAPSPAAGEAQDLVRRLGTRSLDRNELAELAGTLGLSPVERSTASLDRERQAELDRPSPRALTIARRFLDERRPIIPEILALAEASGPIDFGPEPEGPMGGGSGLFWARIILPQLLMADAIERRSRGDFAGAWDEILAQVRLADRFAAGAWSPNDFRAALLGAESAARQGVAWASDPKVTLAAIEAARASLGEVQAVPSAEASIRHEADRIERYLDRSTETLVDEMGGGQARPDLLKAIDRIYNAWVVAPSWERERARRVVRRVVAQSLANLQVDRPTYVLQSRDWSWVGLGLHTPLAERLIVPFLVGNSDRAQSRAVRRMLDLFLALRAWQLAHDGRSPDDLAELFGGDRSRVPLDPLAFQRQPFGYRLDESDPKAPVRLLYSVGPDGQDQNGTRSSRLVGFEAQSGGAFEDIVFALPPDPPTPPKAPEAPASTSGGLLGPGAMPGADPRP